MGDAQHLPTEPTQTPSVCLKPYKCPNKLPSLFQCFSFAFELVWDSIFSFFHRLCDMNKRGLKFPYVEPKGRWLSVWWDSMPLFLCGIYIFINIKFNVLRFLRVKCTKSIKLKYIKTFQYQTFPRMFVNSLSSHLMYISFHPKFPSSNNFLSSIDRKIYTNSLYGNGIRCEMRQDVEFRLGKDQRKVEGYN